MPARTPTATTRAAAYRRRAAGRGRGSAGQAAVEMVALLPIVGLLVVGGLQAAFVGWASWSAADAARAAARAHALGDPPAAAARRALPGSLGHGVRVRARGEAVTVVVRVPRLLPVRVGTVEGTAGMVAQ